MMGDVSLQFRRSAASTTSTIAASLGGQVLDASAHGQGDPSQELRFLSRYQLPVHQQTNNTHNSSASSPSQVQVQVHMCVDSWTQQEYAVHVQPIQEIIRSHLNPNSNDTPTPTLLHTSIESSLQLWKALPPHRNVLKLVDFCVGSDHVYKVWDSSVGEATTSTLRNKLEDMEPYEEVYAVNLMQQILSGLQVLHSHQIVHGNLRPDSVIITLLNGQHVQLTGMDQCFPVGSNPPLLQLQPLKSTSSAPLSPSGKHAAIQRSSSDTSSGYAATNNNIANYWAPELAGLFQNRNHTNESNDGDGIAQSSTSVGKQADIWTCGVIAYVLLAHQMPPSANHVLQDQTQSTITAQHEFQTLLQNESLWQHVSTHARSFITQLFTWDPQARPSAAQALQHEWIVNNVNISIPTTTTNPTATPTSTYALPTIKVIAPSLAIPKSVLVQLEPTAKTLLKWIHAMQLHMHDLQQIFLALMQTNDNLAGNSATVHQEWRLSRGQIQSGYQSLFNVSITQDQLDTLFQHIDQNQSGYLEYPEFVLAALHEHNLLTHEHVIAAFERMAGYNAKGDELIEEEDDEYDSEDDDSENDSQADPMMQLEKAVRRARAIAKQQEREQSASTKLMHVLLFQQLLLWVWQQEPHHQQDASVKKKPQYLQNIPLLLRALQEVMAMTKNSIETKLTYDEFVAAMLQALNSDDGDADADGGYEIMVEPMASYTHSNNLDKPRLGTFRPHLDDNTQRIITAKSTTTTSTKSSSNKSTPQPHRLKPPQQHARPKRSRTAPMPGGAFSKESIVQARQQATPSRTTSVATHHDPNTKFLQHYRILRSLFDSTLTVFTDGDDNINNETNPLTRKKEQALVVKYYVCRHRETGALRVVKMIQKSSPILVDDKECRKALHEFHTAKQLDHANIAKVYDLYTGDDCYYLVMEHHGDLGSNLLSEVTAWGALSEPVAAMVIRQILLALEYLHTPGAVGRERTQGLCLVHRDLRPEHIFLCYQSTATDPAPDEGPSGGVTLQLGGFGRAQWFNPTTNLMERIEDENVMDAIDVDDGDDIDDSVSLLGGGATIVTSPPPEVRGDPWQYGPPSDMWTCGFLAYWMLTLKLPFGDAKSSKHKGNSGLGQSGPVTFVGGKWNSASAEGKDFISKLLSPDRSERLSAHDALEHPWIQKYAPVDGLQQSASSKVITSLSATTSGHIVAKFSKQFNLEAKLQQLVKSLIANQLLLQGEKEAIDKTLDISVGVTLSKQQVQEGYRTILGKELPDDEVDEMFRRISNDGGFISKSEFVIATMNEKDLLCNESLERAFRVFDFEGTGRVPSNLVKDVLTFYKNDKEFLRDDVDYEKVLGAIIAELERVNNKISFDDFMAIMIRTTMTEASEVLTSRKPQKSSAQSKSSQNRRASTLIENVTFNVINLAENAPPVVAEQYTIGDYIRVGRLYKCTHRDSGDQRVLKVLPKSRSDPLENERTLNVYLTLKELSHPSIIKVFDFVEDESFYYAVMEYCRGGNLTTDAQVWNTLSEQDTGLLIKELLSCVSYCHKLHLLHGDVRPRNCLLKEPLKLESVKVIDFRSANFCDPKTKLTRRRGTPGFMAPEVKKGKYGPKCDVWSCGVIAYLAFMRTLSFDAFVKDLRCLVKNGRLSFSDPAWDTVSVHAKDFVSHLLVWKSRDRPTAKKALSHPFMKIQIWEAGTANARRRRPVLSESQILDSNDYKLKSALYTLLSSHALLKEERRVLDFMFDALDVNKNGVLGRKEVKEGYQKLFRRKVSDDDVNLMFTNLGCDTHIDYSRFLLSALNEKELLYNDRLERAFNVLDTNDNGFVSATYLHGLLIAFQKSDTSFEEEIIASISTQVNEFGTQELSFKDFMAILLSATANPNSLPLDISVMLDPGSVEMEENGEDVSANEFVNFSAAQYCITEGEFDDFYDVSGDYIEQSDFGSAVYECTHRETGHRRAVKMYRKTRLLEVDTDFVQREFSVVQQLDNSNILKFFDLFEDAKHFYLVMELARGQGLSDELQCWGKLDEPSAALLLHRLLHAVAYIHRRHVIHRNIIPNNVLCLFNQDFDHVKLTGFGEAVEGDENTKLSTVVTEPNFVCPEALLEESFGGFKADIWSLGMIGYLVLADDFPFDTKNSEGLISLLDNGKVSFEAPVWKSISNSAKDCISKLLALDEDERPFAWEALNHPWFRERSLSDESIREIRTASESIMGGGSVTEPHAKRAARALISSQFVLKKEITALNRFLHSMGKKNDCRLSKKEVQKLYAAHFGQELSKDEVTEMLRKVGGTGYIEYSEFLIAAMNEKNLISNPRLRHAFDVFDNGNGEVNAKELKRSLQGLALGEVQSNGVNAKSLQKIIRQLEKNVGPASMTYDEFAAMMVMASSPEF